MGINTTEDPMANLPRLENCRWARLTLFQPYPVWLSAEAYPWSCVRDGTPRLLETTEVCRVCPFWQIELEEQSARKRFMAEAV
jgi:hypothetical protein